MESVVSHLSLSWQNITIIVFEKYWTSFDASQYEGAEIYKNEIDKDLPKDGGLSGIINEWKRKKYVDKIVNGREFYLYSPIDNRNIHRFLIFSIECKGYFLIEEGLASYFDFSKMQFVKKSIGFKKFVLPLASQYLSQFPINKYDKLKGAFGFFKGVYPYLEHKTIIPIQIKNLENSRLDYSKPVFICDGMVDNGHCSLDFLVGFLRSFFLTNRLNNFYIKFHARQGEVEVNMIKTMMNELNLNYEVLEPQVVVEYLSLQGNINLYGFYSSLLLYNKILGNGESFALGEDLLNRLPEEERKLRSKTIFGDKVKSLFENIGVKQIHISSEKDNQ